MLVCVQGTCFDSYLTEVFRSPCFPTSRGKIIFWLTGDTYIVLLGSSEFYELRARFLFIVSCCLVFNYLLGSYFLSPSLRIRRKLFSVWSDCEVFLLILYFLLFSLSSCACTLLLLFPFPPPPRLLLVAWLAAVAGTITPTPAPNHPCHLHFNVCTRVTRYSSLILLSMFLFLRFIFFAHALRDREFPSRFQSVIDGGGERLPKWCTRVFYQILIKIWRLSLPRQQMMLYMQSC